MAKLDAPTKPTKDTPVSPQDAIDHLRGIEKQVKGHMEKLPDHNPDSFGVGTVRPIRNQGLVIANTSLQVGGEKVGVNIRGREETAHQKTSPTLITLNEGGKETIFEPRRNEQGQVSFVNKATVGEQGRKNGILKPETLEDFVVNKVEKTPNKEFTNQATVKPAKPELTLADGAPQIAAPAADAAKPPHRLAAALGATLEDPAAATARVETAPRGTGAPAITAGSGEGLDKIKAPNLTVEDDKGATQRAQATAAATRAEGQQRDAAAAKTADGILAGSKTPLALEEATAGGTGKGGGVKVVAGGNQGGQRRVQTFKGPGAGI